MAENCVIGNGLLASALKKKLVDFSWYPTEDTKYIFYFGGVRHMDFEKNPDYHMNMALQEFTTLLRYCDKHNVKLIYPSSALVYEKDTLFTKCKRAMEELASKSLNALGLRIFPVYGQSSTTVINEFCDAISRDIQPIIWGDGTQQRDFIFIDDFVDQVLASKDKLGLVNIGSGKPVSFNEIVKIINEILGKDIQPIYIEPPEGYNLGGIYCGDALTTNVNIKHGCEIILGREI